MLSPAPQPIIDLAEELLHTTATDRVALTVVFREAAAKRPVGNAIRNFYGSLADMVERAQQIDEDRLMTEATTPNVFALSTIAMPLAMGSDDVAYAATRLSRAERAAMVAADYSGLGKVGRCVNDIVQFVS